MEFVDPHKKKKQPKKFVSKRHELLEKIKKKEKNKASKPVEVEEKVEEKVVEEKEDTKKKEELSKKAAEKRKAAADTKSRQSSRDATKQKIIDLEKQISTTKYNKKTQHAIGLMKAQLAALKAKLAGPKTGKSTSGYSVKKSGDATVVLLGFPSAGKSTLLNALTSAESETGAYAFTTLTVIPGMLDYKQAKIQILDVPGIVEGAASGSGRGKEVLQVIRTADLILMLIDATKPTQKKLIEKEVFDAHVRINQNKPDVKIRKMLKDGIRVGRTVETEIDDETVKSILNQFKIINAEVLLRDNINADQLIDVIQGNKEYVPAMTVINKSDLLSPKDLSNMKKDLDAQLTISAQKKEHLEELKEVIYSKLKFIRIYLKEINKKADMEEPMIMQDGQTLKDLCQKLHKDFVDKFKYARIWGPSARFDGQKKMKLSHKLKDKDVIEIHLD